MVFTKIVSQTKKLNGIETEQNTKQNKTDQTKSKLFLKNFIASE